MKQQRSQLPVMRRFLALAIALFSLGTGLAAAKGKPVAWKEIPDALLRVNDAPIKEDWSIYQTGKKTDPLLVQMGNRFLLIAVHDHKLFEIDPAKVEHKGDDLALDPSDHPAQPIGTSAWNEGDIGTAFRIEVTITAEDHLLVVELPHPPDISSLPVRTRTATQTRRR